MNTWNTRAPSTPSGESSGSAEPGMTGKEPADVVDPRFRALAEATSAGIFIVEHGSVSYANPALASITGYDRQALTGMNPDELLDWTAGAADASRWPGELLNAVLEVRIRTRAGELRPVELATAPFSYGSGTGMAFILIDITDRRNLENVVERRHQLEAVGRLSGAVAHDFNNLLLVMAGEAERLLEELQPGDRLRTSVLAISKAAGRAAALTHHLLAFGRRQTLIPRPVNLNEVVRQLVEASGAQPTGPYWPALELTAALPAVRVDPSQLEAVLTNLLSNARQATDERGEITIRTDVIEVDASMRARRPWLPHGSWVRLRVADTGPGIAPDIMPRVFEPFFTTRGELGADGLGLSTVYGIVKQSGGFVWIDSTVRRGTTVTVLLAPDAAPAESRHTGNGSASRRAHVLVLEDQDGIRDLLTIALRRQGFDVTAASTGERALQLSSSRDCDLLLTDVILPGMSGPEVAQQLLSCAPSMKVLFMSGYTGEALANQSVLVDERTFIQKPFSVKALVERIRVLLEIP